MTNEPQNYNKLQIDYIKQIRRTSNCFSFSNNIAVTSSPVDGGINYIRIKFPKKEGNSGILYHIASGKLDFNSVFNKDNPILPQSEALHLKEEIENAVSSGVLPYTGEELNPQNTAFLQSVIEDISSFLEKEYGNDLEI